MGEQSVTWRSELLLDRITDQMGAVCTTFLEAYREIEAELLACEEDLKTAAARIEGLEKLLEPFERGWHQEAMLLERCVAQNDELRQEIIRITQQELPFDE